MIHTQEADAAVSILGEMDAWIICPFFLQGGRYTIDDVHYVADSDRLVPAGETEFAKDASFGYKSSNLREWVEEKTAGVIPANSVQSISIQLLRKGGPDAVCEFLCSLKKVNFSKQISRRLLDVAFRELLVFIVVESVSPSCVESLNSISISYVNQGSTCIVNAASERDMAVFAAGMIQVSRPIILLVFLVFEAYSIRGYIYFSLIFLVPSFD
jgi:hypothetical protein